MKKLSILLFGILCLIPVLKAGGSTDYVITAEEVIFFTKLRHSSLTSRFVGIDEYGKSRYQNDDVMAYCKDGHIYERMPVIRDGKETGKREFMELLAYRNGLKVYRHTLYTGSNNSCSDEYLVFHDGKYHVSFSEQNCKTLAGFFFKK